MFNNPFWFHTDRRSNLWPVARGFSRCLACGTTLHDTRTHESVSSRSIWAAAVASSLASSHLIPVPHCSLLTSKSSPKVQLRFATLLFLRSIMAEAFPCAPVHSHFGLFSLDVTCSAAPVHVGDTFNLARETGPLELKILWPFNFLIFTASTSGRSGLTPSEVNQIGVQCGTLNLCVDPHSSDQNLWITPERKKT